MTKARITASIITIALAGVLVSSASIPFHDVSLHGLKPIAQHSVSVPTVSPDITIASCDVAHVPAFTRTDVCVASDGSIVARDQRFTAWQWNDHGWQRSTHTLD